MIDGLTMTSLIFLNGDASVVTGSATTTQIMTEFVDRSFMCFNYGLQRTMLEIDSQQISDACNAATSTALTLLLWSKITEPKRKTEKIL